MKQIKDTSRSFLTEAWDRIPSAPLIFLVFFANWKKYQSRWRWIFIKMNKQRPTSIMKYLSNDFNWKAQIVSVDFIAATAANFFSGIPSSLFVPADFNVWHAYQTIYIYIQHSGPTLAKKCDILFKPNHLLFTLSISPKGSIKISAFTKAFESY